MMPCFVYWGLREVFNDQVASTALASSSAVLTLTSPAFLATVANAIQQVLSAQQVASLPISSSLVSVAISGGISALPAHPSQLTAQASSFATSVAGFASSPPATATPPPSGRPNNFVLPTLNLCRPFPLQFYSVSR